MKILEFLDHLTAKGYCTFSSSQAKEALGVSDIAARAALRRLKQKGALAQPIHGFYVIVPPEYRILGCRPAEHFITELMEYIGAHYYVGLLSAAQHYGAAHHKPQQYQIITSQKRRSIICGRIKIVFITKKDVENTPTQKIKTSHGFITASTPEATVMDLVLYANRAGGLDNALTVLSELIDKVNTKKLLKLVSQSDEITWAQRLGYLLETIKENKISNEIAKKIRTRNMHVRMLDPAKNIKIINFPAYKSKSSLNKKWKLIINRKLEPDT